MKNRITVSIGIPAHNEESNIQRILDSVLKQEEKNFILKEIIVISDGSTDNTVEKAKEINDPRIKVIYDSNRMGKSYRLNQIFQFCQGDILFLIDADIYIKSNTLLSDIITDTNFSINGIIGINANPLPTKSFFAKALNQCKKAEEDWRLKWNNGNNYLVFRGAFMGLYGNFARTINMPTSLVNNDAYIYFLAVKKEYHPKYLPHLSAYFKTPTNFRDHLSQALRFEASAKELGKFFTIYKKDYTIPLSLFLSATLKSFIINPFFATTYIGIRVMTKIVKIFKGKNQRSLWAIAFSTKRANSESD